MNDYLYKISKFFPIGDLGINDYFTRLSATINANYDNGEFQFSYFGIHLILMTNLYSIVWQISKMAPEKYEFSTFFARPFNGSKIKFDNIESVFDFKDLPEKEVINFLYIIGLDKNELTIVRNQIEKRNNMAHASGTYSILDESNFEIEINNVLLILEKCNKCICSNLLLYEYGKLLYNKFVGKDNIERSVIIDFIDEVLIDDLSLSYEEINYITKIGKNKLCSLFKNTGIEQYNDLKKAHSLIQKMCKERYS